MLWCETINKVGMTCSVPSIATGNTTTYTFEVTATNVTVPEIGAQPVNVTTRVTVPGDSQPGNNADMPSDIRVDHTCGQYLAVPMVGTDRRYPCPPVFTRFIEANASSHGPDEDTCCMPLFPSLFIAEATHPQNGAMLIGANASILVTLTNKGDAPAVNVTMTQTLQNGLLYVGDLPQGCNSMDAQTMVCLEDHIAINQSTTYNVTVKAMVDGSLTAVSNVSVPRHSNVTGNGTVYSKFVVQRTCQQYYNDTTSFPCPKEMFQAKALTGQTYNPDVSRCCDELFPDVGISQTMAPDNDTVLIGDNVTFTVTLKNTGQWSAYNITLNQTLPASMEYEGTQSAGCNTTGNNTVNCIMPALNVSANATDVLTAVAMEADNGTTGGNNVTTTMGAPRDNNTANDGPLTSTLTVIRTCSQYNNDRSPFPCGRKFKANATNANNPAPNQGTCCIERFPNVTLESSVAPADVNPIIGNNVTITVVLANTGEWEAINSTLSQTLSPGLGYVQWPSPGCTVTNGTAQAITCAVPSVGINNSTNYTFITKAVQQGIQQVSSTLDVPENTNAANNRTMLSNVTVGWTCGQYFQDGSAYQCPEAWSFNTSTTNATNPDTGTCCIELFPDVVASQTVSNGTILIGDNVNITVTLLNNGTYKASNVTLNQTLPAGLEYVPLTLPSGCAVNAATVMCQGLNIDVGDAPTITLTAMGTGNFNIPQVVQTTVLVANDSDTTNNANVTSTVTVERSCGQYTVNKAAFPCGSPKYYKPNPEKMDNRDPDRDTCCIALLANLTIEEETLPDGGGILIGGFASILVTLTNRGEGPADNVTLNQTLVAGLTYVGTPENCTNSGQILQCSISHIPANGTEEFNMTVRAAAAGNLSAVSYVAVASNSNITTNGPVTSNFVVTRNCLNYNSSGGAFACVGPYKPKQTVNPDLMPDNDTCCDLKLPNVGLQQSILEPTAHTTTYIGDNLTVQVTLTNNGEWAASDAKLTTTLPAGMEYLQGSVPSVCNLSTSNPRRADCLIGSLDVAVPQTINFSVTAVSRGQWNLTSQVAVTGDSNLTDNGPQAMLVQIAQDCEHYQANGSMYPCPSPLQNNPNSAGNNTPSTDICCMYAINATCSLSGEGSVAVDCGDRVPKTGATQQLIQRLAPSAAVDLCCVARVYPINATCSNINGTQDTATAFACGNGTVNNTDAANVSIADVNSEEEAQAICCQLFPSGATCNDTGTGAITCNLGTVVNKTAVNESIGTATSLGAAQNICCIPEVYPINATCSNINGTQDTATTFACGNGTVNNTGAANVSIADVNSEEEAQAICCQLFPSEATCNDTGTGAITCNLGTVANKTAVNESIGTATSLGAAQNICCIPEVYPINATCSNINGTQDTATTFACGNGTVNNTGAANVSIADVNLEEEAQAICCQLFPSEATCNDTGTGAITCNLGTVTNKTAVNESIGTAASLGAAQNICCIPEVYPINATCSNINGTQDELTAFACGNNTVNNTDAANVSIADANSEEEAQAICCYVSCSTYCGSIEPAGSYTAGQNATEFCNGFEKPDCSTDNCNCTSTPGTSGRKFRRSLMNLVR